MQNNAKKCNLANIQNTRGFDVITYQQLSNNGLYIRVHVTNQTVTLHNIYNSLINANWINRFFAQCSWMQASVAKRVAPTIQKIASDFNNGVNSTVNSDTGEKLVSEISRRTLVEDYNYWDMPIAELFKQKRDGNPGFDFHTVTPDGTLLMFGEAKYVANTTAYNPALNQIGDFIDQHKDIMDLFEIGQFMPSQTPLDNAQNNIKGYIAAFSTNGANDNYIISKVTRHKNYNVLSHYPQFIAIAVDL